MKKHENIDEVLHQNKAKIIKYRLWAAKGQPNVDFDYLLGGFGRMPKIDRFLGRPKIVELVPKGGL